jgi:predicted GNAT family N-acyltransferase
MRLELLSTDLLGNERLDAIISLKSQHWPYPRDSQVKWFTRHVAVSDRHLLGWRDDRLVGYLRIVSADGIQESNMIPLALVDTVCVDQAAQGKAFGVALMAAANRAIHGADRVGLLACAMRFVAFYQRCGWTSLSLSVETASDVADVLPAEGNALLVYDPTTRLSRAPLHVSVSDRTPMAHDLGCPSADAS